MLLLSGCASLPSSTPPAWLIEPTSVYPQNRYISTRGSGETRVEAELAARVAMIEYFGFQARTQTEAIQLLTQDNEHSSSQQSIVTQALIESQVKLFATHYADSWQRPGGQWEALAYINRTEAWTIFEPQLKQEVNSFRSLYRAAENEPDNFKKYFMLGAATLSENTENTNETGSLLQLMAFGEILAPEMMKGYTDIRETISTIAQNRSETARKVQISIDCTNDNGGVIAAAFSETLNDAGFRAGVQESAASYILKCSIEENISGTEVTSYSPVINAAVYHTGDTENKEPLAVYSVSMQRIGGAYDPDVAKRRAYNAMAEEIRKTLMTQLENNFRIKR
ncbi:MAG: LPP20 family lipoprotein [Spirochaetaceae bacterium]|nr:LPP20 family lipoprotein [Spirochaetaceae bacterium]